MKAYSRHLPIAILKSHPECISRDGEWFVIKASFLGCMNYLTLHSSNYHYNHKLSGLEQHPCIIWVSVGQESGYGLPGSSSPLLQNLSQGYNQDVGQSWGLIWSLARAGITSKVMRIQLLVNCWTVGLICLMIITQKLLTSLPYGSLHRAAFFIKGSKEDSLEPARKIAVIIRGNIITEVTPHHLGHFLLEESYRSCSHSGGGSNTRVWIHYGPF